MSIELVNFGRVDAESETNLAEYFVDTGVFARLQSGRKQFVVGRKGSGKTALFILATQERFKRSVIQLDFNNYAWESHKKIEESGLSAESVYTASWRFTLLMAVCDHWRKTASRDIAREAESFYKRIYKNEQPGFLEFLFDRFRRVRRVDLPTVEGIFDLGGFELDDPNVGPMLASSISQWSQIILDFVKANFDREPFTITLDRLDDGWDASEKSRMLLVGVLKAAREFNQIFNRHGKPPAVIVFLRSDIFNELQFNDKNKISADIKYLDWTGDKLIDVIEARIGKSLGCETKYSWKEVFSSAKMRQTASIDTYILKRTMGRPRDIIAFCINCQDAARNESHSIVETSDVYKAEESYSKHIYDELDDEMHKQIPNARDILQTVRDMGKTRFSFQEWLQNCQRRSSSITEDEARQRLKILFNYSVVGVQKSGGNQGGTKFQFVYNDRLLEPNFEGDMIVHLSLKKHLSLKEPRSDNND
jgi:hypothetical protein